MKQPDPIARRFVLYFDESVRGLSVGAPVTLYGLPVGEVAERRAELSIPRRGAFVRACSSPSSPSGSSGSMTEQQQADRQGAGGDRAPEDAHAQDAPHGRGAGAARATADRQLPDRRAVRRVRVFPEAPKVKLDWSKDPLELPVVPGGLANIEAKLNSILDQGRQHAAQRDRQPRSRTRSRRSTRRSRTRTRWSAASTRSGCPREPRRSRTLRKAHRRLPIELSTMRTRRSSAKDSPAPQDLRDTLQEVTRAARAVRVFVDYLERHPEITDPGQATRRSNDAPHRLPRCPVRRRGAGRGMLDTRRRVSTR